MSARDSARKKKETADSKKETKRSGDKTNELAQTMSKLGRTVSVNSNDEALMQMNASANVAMATKPKVRDLSGSDKHSD